MRSVPIRFAAALLFAVVPSVSAHALQDSKPESPAAAAAAIVEPTTVPAPVEAASVVQPAAEGTSDTAATPEPAVAPAAAPAADATMGAGDTTLPGKVVPAVMPVSEPAHRKGKPIYTGPNTLVELPATPVLDEEGKQRIDPDGKPIWNEPVHQQRDKNGHPLFDKDGKPVMQTKDELGYDEKGKRLHSVRVKEPKTVSVAIERGTLTIDGMTGKAGLNYDIKDLKYIYLYAPWLGTAIVSNSSFPGAIEQKKAFLDKTLTVSVDGHTFELYSDKPLLGKKPESAWVLVNRDFTLPTKYPVMGYGETLKAPYSWPGAKPVEVAQGPTKAPPLPESLRPVQALQPCPAGQMRATATVLPGQSASIAPCVSIAKGAHPPPSSRPAASAVASESTKSEKQPLQ